MIHFLHPSENKLVGYLTHTGPLAYEGGEHEQEVRGQNRLTFTMPANVPESEWVDKMARILVPHEKEGWQEFVAFETYNSKRKKRVVALGSEILLNKLKIILADRHEGFTLAMYVALATDGLLWEVGNIPNLGIKTRTFDSNLGGFDFLNQVETMFGVEFVYRVEIDGTKVVGRYVDAFVRDNLKPTGKEFVVGKDLMNVEKTIHNNDIVTALWCFGPDREDGTKMAPVFVSDADALSRWGTDGQHLIGIYTPESDDTEMTQARLESLGKTELKKRIASVVDYTIEAVDLSPVYPHETAYLGDVVRIKDPEFLPPLYAEARIISVKRPIKLLDQVLPVPKTFTIGEVKEFKEEDVFKTFRDLQAQYGTQVIKSPTPPTGKANLIWIQTESGKNFDIAHVWNGTDWVPISPSSPGDIGAEIAGAAAQVLQTVRDEMADVIDRVETLEGTIDEAFRDGIIEEAEARSIAKYINSLNTEKSEFDSRYNLIYNSVYLTGALKTELGLDKTAYNTAHTALIAAINMAIQDSRTTPAESLNVDTKFADYRVALADLANSITRSSDMIAAEEAKVIAIEKVDGLERDNLNLIIEGSLRKGFYLSSTDGTETAGEESWITDYMDITGATDVTANTSGWNRWKQTAFYDLNKVFISMEENNNADITVMTSAVPENAVYARFSSDDFVTGKFKFERGNKATPWTPNPADVKSAIDVVQGNLDTATDPDVIVGTVIGSPNFNDVLDTKVDAGVVGDLATKEELQNLDTTVTDRIKNEIEAIDYSEWATKAELEAQEEALRDKLSAAIGSNKIKNSIGYAGTSFWEFTHTSQNVLSLMNDEGLEALGFGSGFYFPADSTTKGIQQTSNVVPGKINTLSWHLNKRTAGSFNIEIWERGVLKVTVPGLDVITEGFNSNFTTYTPETSLITLRIWAAGTVEATITGLMFSLGDLPGQWTLASGELYNAYVRTDENGIQVSRVNGEGDIDGYVRIYPEEFAGYYDENGDGNFERVFHLNKDETVSKKVRAREEFTMGTIKIVRVESPMNTGWVFVRVVDENIT